MNTAYNTAHLGRPRQHALKQLPPLSLHLINACSTAKGCERVKLLMLSHKVVLSVVPAQGLQMVGPSKAVPALQAPDTSCPSDRELELAGSRHSPSTRLNESGSTSRMLQQQQVCERGQPDLRQHPTSLHACQQVSAAATMQRLTACQGHPRRAPPAHAAPANPLAQTSASKAAISCNCKNGLRWPTQSDRGCCDTAAKVG